MTDKQLDDRIQMEKAITRKVVTDAILAGFSVSVYDGGEWTVKTMSTEFNYEVVVESREYGEERFSYEGMHAAVLGMDRLIEKCKSPSDGVTRTIKLVVREWSSDE